MPADEVNDQLATACQKCGSACCKKGQIFLPRDEYRQIRLHAQALGPAAVAEFDSRISDHGLFYLYDQKQGCQFLDSGNLCRLHDIGIKPTECFWWPYHVFAAGPDALEVRLSISCCDAHKTHTPDSSYPALIVEEADQIGFDVIRAFRRAYAGTSTDTRLINRIPASIEPVDQPLVPCHTGRADDA